MFLVFGFCTFAHPDSFVPFCCAPLLEACLHLVKNVTRWACLTQKGKQIKFCSCFVSLSFLQVGQEPSWFQRLSAVKTDAAEQTAASASTLPENELRYNLWSDAEAWLDIYNQWSNRLMGPHLLDLQLCFKNIKIAHLALILKQKSMVVHVSEGIIPICLKSSIIPWR